MARGWLVGFHLIGVVLWMGGLMTFSRILGYHSKELPSARPRFTFIEGRLNWLVSVPGAVLTIVFGAVAGLSTTARPGFAWRPGCTTS